MSRLLPIVAAVLVLIGCTSTPRTPPPPPAPAAQRESPLSVERRWLQSWFSGTPVAISQRDDGPMNIDIPLEFCFDTGRSTVKPALAAVLNKVAESLRRTPRARLQGVAAPADKAGPPALALQRAGELRQHLLSRGVAARQLGNPAATTMSAVQLQIVLSAP